MQTPSLRPTRLPLTDAQRAANRAAAPFGPVTSALYGRQDMRRFFEAGVAALTDGERDILREQAHDSAPTAADLAEMDDEERYRAEREAEAENDRWIAEAERAAQEQWLHRYDGSEYALTEEF
jgi:hypothetical protein